MHPKMHWKEGQFTVSTMERNGAVRIDAWMRTGSISRNFFKFQQQSLNDFELHVRKGLQPTSEILGAQRTIRTARQAIRVLRIGPKAQPMFRHI